MPCVMEVAFERGLHRLVHFQRLHSASGIPGSQQRGGVDRRLRAALCARPASCLSTCRLQFARRRAHAITRDAIGSEQMSREYMRHVWHG